jgi:hypothetical protein
VKELRLLSLATVVLAVLMLAALVSAHERHYAKRRLIHLDARLRALEGIVLEDRSV